MLGNGLLMCVYKVIDGLIMCMVVVGDVIVVGGVNGMVCAFNARSGATYRVAVSGYGEIMLFVWMMGGVGEGEMKDFLVVGS